MSFIALHRSSDTSLAASGWLLSADDVSACESSVELLARLQALLASRQAEAEAHFAQAREAGHAQGMKEALGKALPQLLAEWQQAAEQARADLHGLREAVVTLGCRIVQHIAATMAPADVVAALAAQAARDLVPTQATVVRVHPSVAEAVQAHLAAEGLAPDAGLLEVRAEAGLDLFDCVLDTPAGQLLAGLDTQLAKLSQALTA